MSGYAPYSRPPTYSLKWPTFAAVLLGGVLLWRLGGFGQGRLHDPAAQPRPVVVRGDLHEDEKRTIQIFKQASPSVVYITRVEKVRRSFTDLAGTEFASGTGSGFMWDDQGNIVTNFHVIRGASQLRVTLADKKSYWARYVGGVASKDLAVLKIEAPPNALIPITVGASHDLQVGQKVFAIGNPFGLDQTLTTGVISALNRQIQSPSGQVIEGAIQTDAAINPGNSGGPLLDTEGRLIGVNTAIISRSGSSAGIGFAIPVDTVNEIVTQLIRHGRLVRPGLGISYLEDLNELIRKQLGLEGVAIIGFSQGSPAERAGLETTTLYGGEWAVGDVIVGIDEHEIKNGSDLSRVISKYQVGQEVELRFLRNRKPMSVRLKLTALPGN